MDYIFWGRLAFRFRAADSSPIYIFKLPDWGYSDFCRTTHMQNKHIQNASKIFARCAVFYTFLSSCSDRSTYPPDESRLFIYFFLNTNTPIGASCQDKDGGDSKISGLYLWIALTLSWLSFSPSMSIFYLTDTLNWSTSNWSTTGSTATCRPQDPIFQAIFLSSRDLPFQTPFPAPDPTSILLKNSAFTSPIFINFG